MEEHIIENLKREKRALSVHELETLLNLSGVEDLKELLKALNNLEEQVKIYHTKKDKYMLFEDSNSRVGILQVTMKGTGYVQLDNDEEIKVYPENLNGAINKDRVVVNITDNKTEPMEGEIVKIVERANDQLVGTIYFVKDHIYVKPDDHKLNIKIVIEKNYHNNLVEGHKVLVKLLGLNNHNEYRGQIMRIIGHINDPGVDVLCIMAKHNINDAFPNEVMDEVSKTIPDHITDEEIDDIFGVIYDVIDKAKKLKKKRK